MPEHNVNQGKRKNLTAERRRSKQQWKANKGISARSIVAQVNAEIPDILTAVVEATQKKREQQLLLSDRAYGEPVEDLKKVKWVASIRPAKMGKHGMSIRPTRINKKKVKQMLKRTVSAKAILSAVNSAAANQDIEMTA